MPSTSKNEKHLRNLKEINSMLDNLGLADYMNYLKSPWRVTWLNLLAGMMRGLGFVLGATVVAALLTLLFSYLVSLPLVGQWFVWLKDVIRS